MTLCYSGSGGGGGGGSAERSNSARLGCDQMLTLLASG